MATVMERLKERCGATAVEYALILAIIGGVIALAAFALGTSISGSMNGATDCIKSATSAACS